MKFEGVLAYLDGNSDSQGDSFSPDCKVDISDNITVSYDFQRGLDKVLGTAKVFDTKDYDGVRILRYEIETIDEKVPDNAARQLIPCVGGKVLGRNRENQITDIFLNSIGLALQNADNRIKPLKDE